MEGICALIIVSVVAMIALVMNAARIDNEIVRSKYDRTGIPWNWD